MTTRSHFLASLLVALAACDGTLDLGAPDGSTADATSAADLGVDLAALDLGVDLGTSDLGTSDLGTDLDVLDLGSPDAGRCADVDGDGFRSAGCVAPTDVDCDDGNARVRPGTPEICNGVDDDCFRGVDDALDCGRVVMPLRDTVDAMFWDLAVDPAGNAYIGVWLGATGVTRDPTVDFGGGAVARGADYDGFVVSYAPDGTYRWATRFGGVGLQSPPAVAADATRVVAVLDGAGATIDGTVVADAALVLLDPADGAITHVTPLAGVQVGVTGGVGLTSTGEAVVLGTKTDGTDSDLFLAHFDRAGTELWSRTYDETAGADAQLVQGFGVSPSGVAVFGFSTGRPIDFAGCVTSDAIVALDADGDCLWANPIASSSSSTFIGAVASNDSTVAVILAHSLDTPFGGITARVGTPPRSGDEAVMIFQLDASDGVARAVTVLDTAHDDTGRDLAFTPSGEVVAAINLWQYDLFRSATGSTTVDVGFVATLDRTGAITSMRDIGAVPTALPDLVDGTIGDIALAPDGGVVVINAPFYTPRLVHVAP